MSQRTTLTLEDDVIERARSEARRTGRPFKDIINEALRAGLEKAASPGRERFRVTPVSMGMRPDVELDDIEGLLDRIEGPERR